MAWNDVISRMKARQTATPLGGRSTVTGARAEHDAMTDEESAYGRRGTEAFLRGAEGFDASKSLNRYAGGAWNSIQDALKTTLRDTRGAAVGAGRFDSGFLDEDQGEVINRATSQFSNDIAGQSMNAMNMQQRNTEALGQFGSERSGRATDLLLSREEQVENDSREEEERRRRRRGGIAGAIGGVVGAGAGFLAGGPAGATGGWKAGSAIGAGIGG